MGRVFERMTLFVGMLLYIFDFGSDGYVAFQYYKNNEMWWFSLTVIFILGPSILVNVTAVVHVFNIWTTIAAIFQLTIILRYFEAFGKKEGVILVTKLRYLETLTESAPQLCLQVYIMLRQWNFPWYTILSSVLSLLSVAWGITKSE